MRNDEVNVQLREGAVERAVRRVQIPPAALNKDQVQGRSRVIKLRDRHHTIARLVASNVLPERICKVMGMTQNTLDLLVNQTPAFTELVEYYRPRLAEQKATMEEYMDVLERSMLASELEIADRLQEEPEKLSISDLHKISRDAADRLGYSKHSVNLNVNITLAERLEGLRRRSRAPAGAGDGGGVSSVAVARSAPPLLELKAGPPSSQAPVLEHPAPVTAQPPSEGAMSLREVLAKHASYDEPSPEALAEHRRRLENRRNTTRTTEPPIAEPINRRL